MKSAAGVRTVRASELEDFYCYLETCFGHARGFFQRAYPHLYGDAGVARACDYVIERKGKIVSHVGVYPLHMVVEGVAVPVGGIGGVATLPGNRGKGYMATLLHHSICVMREQGFLVSGLGGDRKRYNRYGWEQAGLVYNLNFTPRSLQKAGVKSVKMTETTLAEAYPMIRRLYMRPICHVRRPKLRKQLKKADLYFWVGGGGYAITTGEHSGNVNIVELVSSAGREAAMIGGMMDKRFASTGKWHVPAREKGVLGRIMPAVSHWAPDNDWLYRIMNLSQLLRAYVPILSKKTAGVKNCEATVTVIEHDRKDRATVTVEDGRVEISDRKLSKVRIELDAVEAVRLVFGGPQGADFDLLPPGMQSMFPLPVHVPFIDRV